MNLEIIFADWDPSIHSRKINSNSFPYHLKSNDDDKFFAGEMGLTWSLTPGGR